MIKEDYLMRQLSDFLEALSKLLSDNQGDFESKVETFYKTFTKFDNDFYKDNDIEYILTTLKSTTNENEFRIKIHILAELFYQDAMHCISMNKKKNLFHKSLILWQLIENDSKTYSFERIDRINTIKNYCK